MWCIFAGSTEVEEDCQHGVELWRCSIIHVLMPNIWSFSFVLSCLVSLCVDQLSALRLELANVCQVQLYVRDMSYFKLINEVYCRSFSHGPPARYGMHMGSSLWIWLPFSFANVYCKWPMARYSRAVWKIAQCLNCVHTCGILSMTISSGVACCFRCSCMSFIHAQLPLRNCVYVCCAPAFCFIHGPGAARHSLSEDVVPGYVPLRGRMLFLCMDC